jgi:hypothetical protein
MRFAPLSPFAAAVRETVDRAVGRYMPRMRDLKAKPKRKHQGRVR